MGTTLRKLLPKLFPDFHEFEHWLIINHQGKSDLERSYPRKMQEWREPGVRFMILRDNDGADCVAMKKQLVAKIPNNAPEYLVRIVCQELESWFLGDMDAVAEAFPGAHRHNMFKTISKRDPDKLTNASELVRQLTGTHIKVGRADKIAKCMEPAINRSASFHVFVNGLTKLFTE